MVFLNSKREPTSPPSRVLFAAARIAACAVVGTVVFAELFNIPLQRFEDEKNLTPLPLRVKFIQHPVDDPREAVD